MIAGGLIAFVAIFYLPTLAPVQRCWSDSYFFGYNNRAGIALLLLFATIGAIWTRGLNFPFRAKIDSPRVSGKVLACSLLVVFVGCTTMYLLAGRFGGFGESAYAIDRSWMVEHGKALYTDVEWAYGAFYIYGTVLLQRLLPIDLLRAYYLFWALNFLLGVVLLWALINAIDYPSRTKRAIFLLFYFSNIVGILTMGIQYTPLRNICPLCFAVMIHRTFTGSGVESQIKACLLAVACTITLLLISPETAVALAFASLSLFWLCSEKRGAGSAVLFGGLTAALGLVFWVALRLRVLDTLRAFSVGAFNFPIYWSPHILFFFAAVFMGACYVFRRLAGAGVTDNTIALILYSIPMMAAALGRCDSGHVLANGEGILIATTFYLSNTRRVWRWYSAAFVLIFIAFPAAEVVWVDKPLFVRLGLDTLSEGNSNSPVSNALFRLGQRYINIAVKPARQAQLERTLENARRGGVPPVIEFPAVYPGWHGGFLAPFGYRPNGIGTYFSSDIDFGYYDGLENALTEAAIARKVAEMKDHPHKALLLPDQFANLCRVNMDAERHQISMLMEFPYLAKAAHPDSIDAPLCGFILERYRQQDEAAAGNFGYAVWVAKADPAHD